MYNTQIPQNQINRYPGNYNQNPNPNFDQTEYIRYNERKILKKTSNGLGFFILAYFVTMQALAIVMVVVYKLFGIDSSVPLGEYLLDVFLSVGAAFIPGLIYLGISRYRLSDGFKKTHVKATVMIPLLLLGMGLSMVANYAADFFDTNISIFGLHNSASITSGSSLSWLEMVIYIIAVSAVPAFAEEFAFRGIVMGRLRKYGDSLAIIASSVMFAAMHSNTTQIVFAFILGLVFAYVDCITDSILPSIGIHFLNNFYAVVFDVVKNNTNISDSTYFLINLGIVLLFCISGLLSFVYLTKQHGDVFKISSKQESPNKNSDYLSLKEKVTAFFTTPGVIISLVVFLIMTITYLLPIDGLLS